MKVVSPVLMVSASRPLFDRHADMQKRAFSIASLRSADAAKSLAFFEAHIMAVAEDAASPLAAA